MRNRFKKLIIFFSRQCEGNTTLRNENETAVPSFRVQSINQHQDTMSLQDVDLGLLHDDQADFDYQDEDKQIPHIERTLTEESAGKFHLTFSPCCHFLSNFFLQF